MRRHLETAEDELKERLLVMGGLAEEMIRAAVEGLRDRKEAPLRTVHENEETVNRLHIEVDDRCLKLIALHQPTAADLRLILAASKINSDLERIGDQAVNIAENAAVLLGQPPLERKLLDLPRMADLAKAMLKDSLVAFVRKDVELARSVIARDDAEDRLKSEAFHELMQIMQSDASTIQRALGLILIARNLERIADHATNVAEDVIFMVLGRDIRHRAEGSPQGS
ncbi:MAG: phosphate signaling complex protein PhoU [Elusimicrobia bacterium]|nr:phosphate signaling complex protein PhoU [Elusimicrobiota bacterium]